MFNQRGYACFGLSSFPLDVPVCQLSDGAGLKADSHINPEASSLFMCQARLTGWTAQAINPAEEDCKSVPIFTVANVQLHKQAEINYLEFQPLCNAAVFYACLFEI